MSVIHEYEGEDWIFSKGGRWIQEIVKWKVKDGEIVPIEEGLRSRISVEQGHG